MKIHTPIVVTGLLALCVFNAALPLIPSKASATPASMSTSPWPTQFMGEELYAIPLSEKEAAFYEGFPGEAAQFTTLSERLILRRIHQPTRKLHPAQDCFKGMGYSIEDEGLQRDPYERIWRGFIATKAEQRLKVRELIVDEVGNTWSDVSAWYWSALMGRTEGPWLSYVRIRNLDTERDLE